MENLSLDEYELSFPVHVWEKFLYEGLISIVIDIYYTQEGFPKEIHDRFGAEELFKLREQLIAVLRQKNRSSEIWRISSDGFAIKHDKANCAEFAFDYQGIPIKILKKTVSISVV